MENSGPAKSNGIAEIPKFELKSSCPPFPEQIRNERLNSCSSFLQRKCKWQGFAILCFEAENFFLRSNCS